MFANQLGHFEHRNFLFSSEYSLQVSISIDISLVYWILQLVLFDISPQFFGNFCSWKWLTTYNFCQFFTNLHGLHKCRIWLSLFLDNCFLSDLLRYFFLDSLSSLLYYVLLSSFLLCHFFSSLFQVIIYAPRLFYLQVIDCTFYDNFSIVF